MNFNPFHYAGKSAIGPSVGSIAITPDNNADLATDVRAVTIGQAGSLSWVGVDGKINVTANLPPGTYPLFARRIRSTGTTAAQITGWL